MMAYLQVTNQSLEENTLLISWDCDLIPQNVSLLLSLSVKCWGPYILLFIEEGIVSMSSAEYQHIILINSEQHFVINHFYFILGDWGERTLPMYLLCVADVHFCRHR